jgi:phage gp46-like protein
MADSVTIALVTATNAAIVEFFKWWMPPKARRAAVWSAWSFRRGKQLRAIIVRASAAVRARKR